MTSQHRNTEIPLATGNPFKRAAPITFTAKTLTHRVGDLDGRSGSAAKSRPLECFLPDLARRRTPTAHQASQCTPVADNSGPVQDGHVTHMQAGFAMQVPVDFDLHGYELTVPSGHVLLQLHSPGGGLFQPYREQGLAEVVTALERLGRRGIVVDIGANIGDTLALIARYSTLDVLCVEPSDYFLKYLRDNVARHFADRAVVADCYVTAHEDEPARALFHWGGTAKPIDGPYSEHGGVVSIGRLVDEAGDVALVKIDTDGTDLALVGGSLDLPAPAFPIYFELEITTPDRVEATAACARARQLFARLVGGRVSAGLCLGRPGTVLRPPRSFGRTGRHQPAQLSDPLAAPAGVGLRRLRGPRQRLAAGGNVVERDLRRPVAPVGLSHRQSSTRVAHLDAALSL